MWLPLMPLLSGWSWNEGCLNFFRVCFPYQSVEARHADRETEKYTPGRQWQEIDFPVMLTGLPASGTFDDMFKQYAYNIHASTAKLVHVKTSNVWTSSDKAECWWLPISALLPRSSTIGSWIGSFGGLLKQIKFALTATKSERSSYRSASPYEQQQTDTEWTSKLGALIIGRSKTM